MSYKIFFAFLFAAILALSAVSALQITSSSIPANISSSATSMPITFTLNNPSNNASAVVSLSNSITNPAGSSVSFSPASGFTLLPGQSTTVTATVNVPVSKSGSVTGQILATSAVDANATLSFSVPITAPAVNFCRFGPRGGNLSISDFSIDTDGDDEETWRPLDVITVEVEVENIGDDDIDDVVVELGLFDSAGRNQVNDMEFFSEDEEQIELGDLNDGDEETVSFEFKVPADAEAGDYDLKVKVYSDDSGESNQCVDSSDDLDSTTHQNIDIEEEDDEGRFIAFDNVEFNPTEATCGDQVTLSFDVYNIGDEEQDQVKVLVEGNELKISQSEEIKQGLDQGDHESMLFTFTVPNGLSDRTYNVDLSAEYDYRSGQYREESEEVSRFPIRIFGCGIGGNTGSNTGGNTGSNTGSNNNVANIAASLDSDAKAGERLTVTVSITNTQNRDASFVVDASGYNAWADLASVSDRLIEIDAGESEEVTLTFDVDEDAEGQQGFAVEVTSAGNTVTRNVVVELEDGAASGGNGSVFKNNGLIWGIAIVNVVLLIAIILVAIKLSRN